MKEKIIRIILNIRNTVVKLYMDTVKKARPGGTGKNTARHFFSTEKKNGKHTRKINLKRFIPVVTAFVVLVVLAVIIFTPPKEKASASQVAGEMQSAESLDNPAAGTEAITDTAVAEGQTPPEGQEQSPEQSDEPEKKEEKKPAKAKSLAPNTHSDKVIEMQEKLMDLDYMEYDEPTDYYGPQTQYSLQLFQRKHNLQVDGIAGESTLKLLFSKEAKPYTVFLGERGTDVEALQSRLIELGYLKGKPTGYFGTDTENAVKAFQKRNDLSIDGNVGSNTREVIYSEDANEAAKPKKTPVKPPKKDEKSTKKIPDDKSVNSLIAFAKQQLGEPYVRGGKGPDKFDCSGFVYYCLKNIGVKIGYMTSGGWAGSSWPKVTEMKNILAGDILCFRGHVGIYLGGGKMIDASSGQGKIRITGNIFNSKYWKRYFICARRVL